MAYNSHACLLRRKLSYDFFVAKRILREFIQSVPTLPDNEAMKCQVTCTKLCCPCQGSFSRVQVSLQNA